MRPPVTVTYSVTYNYLSMSVLAYISVPRTDIVLNCPKFFDKPGSRTWYGTQATLNEIADQGGAPVAAGRTRALLARGAPPVAHRIPQGSTFEHVAAAGEHQRPTAQTSIGSGGRREHRRRPHYRSIHRGRHKGRYGRRS